MFRSTLTLLLVLLAGSALGVAAQSPEEGVLLVPQGRAQSVPFKGLGGASVGNVVVAYIERMKPDEVSLYGAVPGETSLELIGRDGRRKRFSVRVTAAPPTVASAPSLDAIPKAAAKAAPAEVGAPADAPHAVGAAQPSGETKPRAAAVSSGLAAGAQRGAAVKAPPVEAPRARRPLRSRLGVAVSTMSQSAKQDVRFVSNELLKPGKLAEAVSADSEEKFAASTQREQTMTVSSSSLTTTVSASYEINGRNTLSVDVPLVRRVDKVTAGGSSVKTHGQGLGDVQVRFEREQPRLRGTAWDGTVELSVGLPTGKSVYNVGKNEVPLGNGHYEVGGLFGVSRIFDPFNVNAAAGVIYTLPRTVHDTRVAPGLGYMAQTGFDIALSDRWVLSEEMSFTRRPNVLLSTPTDATTTSTDQSYLQHGLLYRPKGGHTFQATFNLGLNSASSDYGLGFRWAYRGGGGRAR